MEYEKLIESVNNENLLEFYNINKFNHTLLLDKEDIYFLTPDLGIKKDTRDIKKIEKYLIAKYNFMTFLMSSRYLQGPNFYNSFYSELKLHILFKNNEYLNLQFSTRDEENIKLSMNKMNKIVEHFLEIDNSIEILVIKDEYFSKKIK